jgi:hypothetical protein
VAVGSFFDVPHSAKPAMTNATPAIPFERRGLSLVFAFLRVFPISTVVVTEEIGKSLAFIGLTHAVNRDHEEAKAKDKR